MSYRPYLSRIVRQSCRVRVYSCCERLSYAKNYIIRDLSCIFLIVML
jgi:hypothetical protein